MSWADLKAMVIHLPAESRFKSTFDPDGRMRPPESDAPTLSAAQVRERIRDRYR